MKPSNQFTTTDLLEASITVEQRLKDIVKERQRLNYRLGVLDLEEEVLNKLKANAHKLEPQTI